jgi:hypothetical protein
MHSAKNRVFFFLCRLFFIWLSAKTRTLDKAYYSRSVWGRKTRTNDRLGLLLACEICLWFFVMEIIRGKNGRELLQFCLLCCHSMEGERSELGMVSSSSLTPIALMLVA